MRIDGSLTFAGLVALATLGTGFDCGAAGTTSQRIAADATWTHPQGGVGVSVAANPFSLTIVDDKGSVLVESTPPHDDGDPYAPLSFTHDEDLTVPAPMKGWDYFRGQDDPWHRATVARSIAADGDALVIQLATNDSAHASISMRIEPHGPGVRIAASVDGPGDDPDSQINRMSLGFAMHGDDHFFGFGERFVRSDHRGQILYTWVEDGGFGQGEDTPPGPSNPSPHGEGQTNMPIPWFMSPRGFGVFMPTALRTLFHLGDDSGDSWRAEQWAPSIDVTIFADPDPNSLVADLTAITGRPPAIADWLLAPRRRANIGTTEWDKLRQAHVPTSVIDTAVHYFPNGGVDHARMRQTTQYLHTKGFKVVAYFAPFVADSWHPVFDDASAKGYLVKRADGSTYTVLDPPYNAAMVDFTNPDAVTWYQSELQRALDDGFDGWMYDFAEYVPLDAVFANGMSGMEAHNLYPVLYQKAARDFFDAKRPGDYLFFARSGYAGTGGTVPMVWAGDQNTDFDLADGLPAALQGALNVGMSGVPLWGSDISGYHFIYNPPPDKEVYLRWTELGAFSADMHDENEGAGNAGAADRWQIWKDQDTLSVYAKYASLKTRMLPYTKIAVRQARDRGTPVMRHLFLDHPRDARVWTIGDEYMYGDSLLVAPVVKRGQRARGVYLPAAAYFDYWSGARVAGGGDVTAAAPLDAVPVFARIGAIVPMLAPDVETVVPSSDGSVVSAADRADFLQVDVFAGGATSVTLDDGTVLSQSAPTDAFSPGVATRASGSIPSAASEADLATCDACVWDDAADRVWTVAIKTQSDSISAPPLTLSTQGSPNVKRFVFRVRH